MPGRKPGGPKTGGRQKGSRNKRTIEQVEAMKEAASKIATVLGDDAFDGDAHAFLIAVYKDPEHSLAARLAAATAAIGYEKSKLASIEGKITSDVTVTDKRNSAAEVARRLDRLAASEQAPERLN